MPEIRHLGYKNTVSGNLLMQSHHVFISMLPPTLHISLPELFCSWWSSRSAALSEPRLPWIWLCILGVINISLHEMEAHYVSVFPSSKATGAVAEATATTSPAPVEVIRRSWLEHHYLWGNMQLSYEWCIFWFLTILAILLWEASLDEHGLSFLQYYNTTVP